MKKKFERDQQIEFQPEPGAYVAWHPGTYIAACDDWKGWHKISAVNQYRYVPTRRLRARGAR